MTAQAQCAGSEAAARGGCDAAGGSMTGGGKRRPRGAAGPDGEQVAVSGRAGRGGKWWCLRGRACARHRPCGDRGQLQPPPEVPWPGSELRGPQLRGRRPESAWVPCRSAGPRPPCPLFCSPRSFDKSPWDSGPLGLRHVSLCRYPGISRVTAALGVCCKHTCPGTPAVVRYLVVASSGDGLSASSTVLTR